MIRSYILLAALGLATAACGSSNEPSARGDAAGANGPRDVMANVGPDGVVPGGAVDVLRREGWRVETVQQADASAVGQPAASAS